MKSATITQGDTVHLGEQGQREPSDFSPTKGQFVSSVLRPKQSYSFTFQCGRDLHLQGRAEQQLAGTIKVNGLPRRSRSRRRRRYGCVRDKVTLSGTVSKPQGPASRLTIYYRRTRSRT